ncbi:MAG: ROK family protein [Bacteroidota bacterium]
MKKVAAGMDIGGTNTVMGLVDEKGRVLARAGIPTRQFKTLKAYIGAVSGTIRELAGNKYTLIGTGIGAPNGNFFTGCIEFAPNLPWKGKVPLAKRFSKALRCPVILTNDANAAALGEKLFGAAKKMNDFIFITLGTGLGSGIVVNGALVYGHDGMAGELGHVIVEKNGRPCGCGRRGCLETYCSATGIVSTYVQLTGNCRNETAADSIDARYVFERARAGEEQAIEAFRFTGEVLGLALANSVTHTSPEAIFLFGGLTRAGRLLFGPVKQNLENNLLKVYRGKIKLLPSRLPESDAAVLGAASLIWNEKNTL